MTTEEALEFLQHHQPMPSDLEVTSEEGKLFIATLEWFEQHPDPRCVPLFVHSVSSETSLGMYESIRFVLMAHDKNLVVSQLRQGLIEGDDGVKARCCWWAIDMAAWELMPLIEPLAQHSDGEMSGAAQSFLELRAEWHNAR